MFDSARFKELLDTRHQWPGNYTFKFVCAQAQIHELSAIFAGQEVVLRDSAKGKYVSLTVTMHLESSDKVIEIYQKAAAKVPGLIAL